MSKQGYIEAVNYFLDVVRQIRAVQWDDPCLGVWTVRDVVGHAGRAITLVEEFGVQRAESLDIRSAAEHYHVSLAPKDIDTAIADRGREAGRALGNDPVATLQAAWRSAQTIAEETPDSTVISYTNGGIRLGDYLDTRILELVVHTLDLTNATAIRSEPPRAALADTLHLLAELALDSGYGGQLALAVTGRGILADRFSVLG